MAKIESEEWDRLPFESSQMYSYFSTYLAMPQLERSVKAVAAKVGRSVRRMWDISSKWDWLKRAEAYDLHMLQRTRAVQERARLEMNERQAKEGVTVQNIAMGGVANLIGPDGRVRANLTPIEIAKLLDTGVKIERLARGEPTENVSESVSGEVKVVRLPSPTENDDEWSKQCQEEYERRQRERGNDMGTATRAANVADPLHNS